jgi:hypothetical protein
LQGDKPKKFPTGNKRDVTASADNFAKIPGSPVAYWVSSHFVRMFDMFDNISNISFPKQGLHTGNNDLYLRFWQEVNVNDIYLAENDSWNSNYKWALNKGGMFRKWYGNRVLEGVLTGQFSL